MKYRRLGSTGLLVSTIGLGANNFGQMSPSQVAGDSVDLETTSAILDACQENGINFVDTSDLYSEGQSEEFIGQSLKGRRHDFVIGSKAGMKWAGGVNREGLTAAHLKRSIDDSLRRLQTDYIDLYQMHIQDPLTSIEETLRALDDIVASGKVRYVGCSNFLAWEVVEAIQISRRNGWPEFATVEAEFSMLEREPERELVHAAAKYETGILPYYPLASGFLTGKYKRGMDLPEGSRLARIQWIADRHINDESFDLLESLERFASERGHTIVELAFAWLLAHPEVSSVIAGATRVEQVVQNAAASEWELTAADMAELDGILPGTPGPGTGNLPRRRSL
ncbi:MAG: aldo/keto reductase [Dehalococcoidia bacterium]|nr:aldo/keto reductase [Dehalococcoidia bacterium]